VVNLAWRCGLVYILDQYLGHTTGEQETEFVLNHLSDSQRHIQLAENPTPAVEISVEAAGVDSAILLDYFTSGVALELPEFGCTDPNIQIDNICMDDELHFGMPGGSGDYKDEGDKSNERDAIPTTCRRRWAATDLERIDLVTSDVKRFEGDNGDNADANEEEEASQADDVSMQNVGD